MTSSAMPQSTTKIRYNLNYVNDEVNYLGNPYPASYGISSMNQMNPVQPITEG
ncbi:hypothetical protein Lser_V15G35224 [Lactuca serriola]